MILKLKLIFFFLIGGLTISGYFGQHEHPIHGNFRPHCLRHRSLGQGCRHWRRRRTSGKDCSGHPLWCLQRLRRLRKASRPSIIHATQIAANAMEDSFKNRRTTKLKEDTRRWFFFFSSSSHKKRPFFSLKNPQALPTHWCQKSIFVQKIEICLKLNFQWFV